MIVWTIYHDGKEYPRVMNGGTPELFRDMRDMMEYRYGLASSIAVASEAGEDACT